MFFRMSLIIFLKQGENIKDSKARFEARQRDICNLVVD